PSPVEPRPSVGSATSRSEWAPRVPRSGRVLRFGRAPALAGGLLRRREGVVRPGLALNPLEQLLVQLESMGWPQLGLDARVPLGRVQPSLDVGILRDRGVLLVGLVDELPQLLRPLAQFPLLVLHLDIRL